MEYYIGLDVSLKERRAGTHIWCTSALSMPMARSWRVAAR